MPFQKLDEQNISLVFELCLCRELAGLARGQGLGRRLLAAAIEMAPESWDVRFLKLAVYDDNPRARAFYDRLGFEDDPRETVLRLAKTDFDRLTDET